MIMHSKDNSNLSIGQVIPLVKLEWFKSAIIEFFLIRAPSEILEPTTDESFFSEKKVLHPLYALNAILWPHMQFLGEGVIWTIMGYSNPRHRYESVS